MYIKMGKMSKNLSGDSVKVNGHKQGKMTHRRLYVEVNFCLPKAKGMVAI